MTARATTLWSTLAVFTAVAITVTGCSTAGTERAAEMSDAGLLGQNGLAGLDARDMIDHLDTMPVAERPADLLASVQPESLVLTSGEQTASVALPDNEFYLALAPYENRTHGCSFHSLTTCLGELQNEEMRVSVTDQAGNTLLDDTRTTFDNGFLGIWLPRGLSGVLTVEHDGKFATSPISTGDDDLTCLTSLRLV